MHSATETTPLAAERREDMSIGTLRYLEQRIAELRRSVMELASIHADARQPGTPVYSVEPQDIEQVFCDLLQK